MRLTSSSSLIYWILLIAIALDGMALLWYITPYGLGLMNDSVAYIGGARAILEGKGYGRVVVGGDVKAITNYPPMLSLVLSGIGLSGLDVIRADRLLNALLFAGVAILIGYFVHKTTRSNFFALLGAVIFCISAPFLLTFSVAMSEPFYLFLSLLVLFLLARYLEKNRAGWLIVVGISSGLAYLTRYVGISLFSTVLVTLLVFRPGWKKKVRDCLIYLASGLPFILIWTLRNMTISDNPANRMFAWHPIPPDKVQEGVMNFWSWLLPDRLNLVQRLFPLLSILLYGFTLVLIIGLIIMVVKNRQRWLNHDGMDIYISWIFGIYAIIYLGTLILSLTFIDASPIFENRILSPIFLCLIVIGMKGCLWLWQRPALVSKIITAILILFLLSSLSDRAVHVAQELHQDGQGFASAVWRDSETMQAVRELPDKTIYSNKATAINLLANRPSYVLPSYINPATQQPRPNYQTDLNRMKELVLQGAAVIVIFGYYELMESQVDSKEIQEITSGLQMIRDYKDGTLFGGIK